MTEYTKFIDSIGSHKKHILSRILLETLEIPKLKQKIADLRVELSKKEDQKKRHKEKLFELNFLLGDIKKIQNKDYGLILLEDCLVDEKSRIEDQIANLNIDKIKQKLNTHKKDLDNTENRINKLSKIMEIVNK
jgi:ribosomal protein S15P/S13E